ncbi:MAG: hypothetical protein ABI584_12455 [Acidobacteriota bacterium]
MTKDPRPPSALGKAVSVLLALLPPARMAWIVFSNGENNLSNDYGMRVPLVVSMLDGTCTFARFFHEAWVGASHSLIALVPIYYLNARFFDWSVWIELGLGLAFVAATLVLLVAATPRAVRWWLLPLVSLLLFSTSRVSVFTFGEPSLQYGLSQLGVAIAACALAVREPKPIAFAVALTFGGVLASWSWGGGVMVWPVLAAALALQRTARFATWAILAFGAVAALAQYVCLLPSQLSATKAEYVPLAMKGLVFLDVLGRPFVRGISHSELNSWSQAVGAAGLLGLVPLLVILRKKIRELLVPLVLIAWSLLVAAQIALVRAAVAPWYASPSALFWVGFLMLLAAAPVSLGTAGIIVIAVPSLINQFTWEDKSFYLPSRSPAAAACLREWRSAPVAWCGERLFQWKGGAGPGWLGEPLERKHLSVFGARGTYLLQGDAAIGRVSVGKPIRHVFLSRDGQTPGDLLDFHRLDLVLAPGARVIWQVDLPPGAHAVFSTVVRAAPGDSQAARGALVSVGSEGSSVCFEERAFLPRETARPLSVDLSSLAGRSITLRISADETHEGETPLVFESPKIELRGDR